MDAPAVIAVARSATNGLTKRTCPEIRLLDGLGVEGDAHCGERVRHRSRAASDPSAPNLRQVHLIHGELYEELAERGFTPEIGHLGENVTTRGVPLLALPRGTRLALGEEAVVELTGLRNPCRQLDRLAPGLQAALAQRDERGAVVRKAGVMAVVVRGGVVRPGDRIEWVLPTGIQEALAPV